MLEPDRTTLKLAMKIAKFQKTTYDAFHAALAIQHGVDVVITEDLENRYKIIKAWEKIKREVKIKELTVLSPSRNLMFQST